MVYLGLYLPTFTIKNKPNGIGKYVIHSNPEFPELEEMMQKSIFPRSFRLFFVHARRCAGSPWRKVFRTPKFGKVTLPKQVWF